MPDQRFVFTNLVEYSEGFSDLLLTVGVLHLSRHHRQELGEVNRAVSCKNKTKN